MVANPKRDGEQEGSHTGQTTYHNDSTDKASLLLLHVLSCHTRQLSSLSRELRCSLERAMQMQAFSQVAIHPIVYFSQLLPPIKPIQLD